MSKGKLGRIFMAVQSLTETPGGHGWRDSGDGGHQGSSFRAVLQEHLGLFIGTLDAVEKHFADDSAALQRQSYYAHKMYYRIFLGGGEDIEALVAQTNTPSPMGGGEDVGAFVARTDTPPPVVANAGMISPPTQSRKNRSRRLKRQRHV